MISIGCRELMVWLYIWLELNQLIIMTSVAVVDQFMLLI